MSLDSFLEHPYGHSTNNQQKPVIAQAEIWPAWESNFGAERNYFNYRSDTTGENERLAKELADSANGGNGYVNLGILTKIHAKDAIQSNFSEDWYSFVRSFHSKVKYTEYFNTENGRQKLQESKHFEDISAFVENGGPFPYDIVIERLRQNPAVFESKRWCRLTQENEGVMEIKGIRNRSGYPYQFFVVEKVYENRQAALEDATDQPVIEANAEGVLSAIGTKNYNNVQGFITFINSGGGPDMIANQIRNAVDGIDMKGEKAKPMTPEQARSYVASEYGVEPVDFKFLEIDIPF